MVGHRGSSAGLYLADPTCPIPSHCASIVMTSTVRVKLLFFFSGSRACSCVWKTNLPEPSAHPTSTSNRWKSCSQTRSVSSSRQTCKSKPTLSSVTRRWWSFARRMALLLWHTLPSGNPTEDGQCSKGYGFNS